MIMPRGQQLLLPASPLFIWSTLTLAMLINMFLNMGWFGREAWMPDVLALVLLFWSVHQPLRVGMGAAFLMGLAMDVHQSALLGQHALAYTALSFLAISMQRRLLWFPVGPQMLQVLPLFVAAQLLELLVRLIAGHGFPGVWVLLGPLLETALWPVATMLLLAPQRRAHDLDENRPL